MGFSYNFSEFYFKVIRFFQLSAFFPRPIFSINLISVDIFTPDGWPSRSTDAGKFLFPVSDDVSNNFWYNLLLFSLFSKEKYWNRIEFHRVFFHRFLYRRISQILLMTSSTIADQKVDDNTKNGNNWTKIFSSEKNVFAAFAWRQFAHLMVPFWWHTYYKALNILHSIFLSPVCYSLFFHVYCCLPDAGAGSFHRLLRFIVCVSS